MSLLLRKTLLIIFDQMYQECTNRLYSVWTSTRLDDSVYSPGRSYGRERVARSRHIADCQLSPTGSSRGYVFKTSSESRSRLCQRYFSTCNVLSIFQRFLDLQNPLSAAFHSLRLIAIVHKNKSCIILWKLSSYLLTFTAESSVCDFPLRKYGFVQFRE